MEKILVCGDIHGRYYAAEHAFDKFTTENYDKIIFIGDYVDSYYVDNIAIVSTLKTIIDMKNTLPDSVILLLGNHDIQYVNFPSFRASGFRPLIQKEITSLFLENIDSFDIAYQKGSHLFSHAGINNGWFKKYMNVFARYFDFLEIPEEKQFENIANVLNLIQQGEDRDILHECGPARAGSKYNIGGVTWCDKTEMQMYGPISGLHQIVGHTPQDKINTFTLSDRTSVTFIDVLNTKEDFLTLNI